MVKMSVEKKPWVYLRDNKKKKKVGWGIVKGLRKWKYGIEQRMKDIYGSNVYMSG